MSREHWPLAVTLPPGGWKAHTWYVVSCSFAAANPRHRCLMFTGFLNDDDTPGGYSGIIALNYAPTDPATPWNRVREVHFVRELCNTQGEPPAPILPHFGSEPPPVRMPQPGEKCGTCKHWRAGWCLFHESSGWKSSVWCPEWEGR